MGIFYRPASTIYRLSATNSGSSLSVNGPDFNTGIHLSLHLCIWRQIIKYVPAKSSKCENTQQNRWLTNDRCGRLASFWLMREGKQQLTLIPSFLSSSTRPIVLCVMRFVTLTSFWHHLCQFLIRRPFGVRKKTVQSGLCGNR